MRELLDSFLEIGLADFEGLQISGTIPVKTELINEIIADFLKPSEDESDGLASAASVISSLEPVDGALPAAATVLASKPKKVSLQKVIRPLIRHVAIRAVEGKIVVEFDVRR